MASLGLLVVLWFAAVPQAGARSNDPPPNAEMTALFAKARQYLDGGDTEQALALLAPAAGKDEPQLLRLLLEIYLASFRLEEGLALGARLERFALRDSDLCQDLALLYAEHGQVAKGIALLARTLEERPRESRLPAAGLFLTRARLRFSLGAYSEAADDLARVPPAARGEGGWYLVGACAARAQNDQQALAALEKVLSVNPHHVPARFERGMVHYRRQEFAAARREFWACLRDRPDHLGALFNLGNALIRTGETEAGHRVLGVFRRRNANAEAEKDLRQAVLVNPGNRQALLELAQHWITGARREKARPLVERVLHAHPGCADAWACRGDFHRLRGDAVAARRDYEEALSRNEDLDTARLSLAEVCASSGDTTAATHHLDALGERNQTARFHLARAEIAARRGRPWGETALHVRRAVERDPHRMEAILAWVDLSRAHRKTDAARAALRAWAEGDATNACFLVGQGVLALEEGELPRARSAFENALRLDPALGPAHGYLAEVLRREGRPREAKRHATRAEELRILAEP